MASYQNYQTECFENLKQLCRASADRYGQKTLFLQKRGDAYEQIGFHRFQADVNALGTALLLRGFGGKKILILGENSYEWACAYMAVVCGVGIAVPVSPSLSSAELLHIVNRTEAAAVICSASAAAQIKDWGGTIEQIRFDRLQDWISDGKTAIKNGNRDYLDAKINPDALAVLLFTSGTASEMRGVMLSHRNICFNLSEICKMVYIDEKDVFLSVLPLHHAYECTCGFLCPLYRGSTVAFADRLHHLSRSLHQIRPTVMLCVPLFLKTVRDKIWTTVRTQGAEQKIRRAIRATNALRPNAVRLSVKRKTFSAIHNSFGGRLRLLISGGSMADSDTLQDLQDLGFCVIQGYGMTECAPVIALNRDSSQNNSAVGMSTPNTLLDICDAQNDGIGEIRYKGDNTMLGYYKQPELTDSVIRDGWLYTGDLGYMDNDGFLYIIGRKQNMITDKNGRNIFPEELESKLCQMPYIKEAAVIGCQNPTTDSFDAVALIYPDYDRLKRDFKKAYTASRLDLEMKKALSAVNSTMPPYKRIATYLLRTEGFPKNTSGKIIRKGLLQSAYQDYLAKLQ